MRLKFAFLGYDGLTTIVKLRTSNSSLTIKGKSIRWAEKKAINQRK